MSHRWTDEDYQALMVRYAKEEQRRAIAKLDQAYAPVAPTVQIRKRPKYGNRKVTDAEGNVHDSTKEFKHWQELQLRAHAGDIRSLRRQVPYALVWNGVLICRYIADFVYEEGAALHVVDCKSDPTRKLQVYRLKKLMMKACHNIEVREV